MKLTELLEKSNGQNFLANLTKVNLILDISNVIDENFLLQLADALWNCINLQEFSMQYGFIGMKYHNTCYNIVFLALQNCKKLKNFDIAFNHVGKLNDLDVEALSLFIASSNLENINFKDNELDKLSPDNLKTLFDALAKCKHLKYLNISDNDLHIVNDIKFDIICTSLKNCEKLLDFSILVPYISSEREKKISEIKSYITQQKKAPIQTMIMFSQEKTLPLDENEKLPEENIQVTVEQNKNILVSKCILM